MPRTAWFGLLLTFALLPGVAPRAQTPESGAKPIPQDRRELKRALEALKRRQSRLPLDGPAADQAAKGPYGRVHNGLARALYLPAAWYAADFKPDPAMTLDPVFKVRMFWIAARGNNCHYCLGHQEVKLSSAGMTDDEIAALDFEWTRYPAAEQAAFDLTRKLTVAPHTMTAADIEALRAFYTDAQIIELVYTAAFYNSVTRWTDSTGIPQDENFRDHKIQFDTPTAELWNGRKSLVVGEPRPERPALEDRSAAEQAMAAAARRAPLVALTPGDVARGVYGDLFPDKIPQWALALAAFPQVAKLQATAFLEIEHEGRSDPLLRAQLAWISARHNRAWYALAAARDRLLAQGQSLDDIFRLDDPDAMPPGRREALRFARKLTVRPQSITDDNVAELRAHFSAHEVAEIVYTLCAANLFDRFTESLQLSAN